MKIAVTSTGPSLDDKVEVRFGCCAYFLIVDPDTLQTEAIENPNLTLGGGAGIQSAQLMSEKGVSTVLTGNCGPNAFQVFGQAGIQVIVGVSGTVRQAVEQFKKGEFSAASVPNVSSHFGMGRGGGMGRGMGRRMGMTAAGAAGPGDPSGPADELTALRQQADMLEQQKQQIHERISRLQGGGRAVAVVNADQCTGCGACLGVCPAGAIEMKQANQKEGR